MKSYCGFYIYLTFSDIGNFSYNLGHISVFLLRNSYIDNFLNLLLLLLIVVVLLLRCLQSYIFWILISSEINNLQIFSFTLKVVFFISLLFPFVFFLLLCLMGVHYGFYKSSYNVSSISYLNSHFLIVSLSL
jgi:hypothetical protein